MLRRTVLCMAAAPWWMACAAGGTGSNPPLPGGPTNNIDDGASLQGEDASEPIPGNDASTLQDDGGAPSDIDGALMAGTCNDLLHGLEALGSSLLGSQPDTCAESSDCPAGQCCYVSATASACVKQ